MIKAEHYDLVRETISGLPPAIEARLLTPPPTDGEDAPIDTLRIVVGAENGMGLGNTAVVTEAFILAGLTRQDYGRGGNGAHVDVPLQYEGSVGQPNNGRILLFGPFGRTILQ